MPPEKALDPRKDLLRNPNYRWLLSGAMITNLGDQFTLIALPWLVLQMTHDTRVLGLVLALIGVPRAIFILVGGAVVDHHSPKQVLMITKFINTFLLGLLAVLVWREQAALWIIYALSLGIGVSTAFSIPSGMSILPQVVQPSQLAGANGMMMGLRQLALFLGPLLAGLMMTVFGSADGSSVSDTRGLGAAFGIDALSFTVSAWTLSKVQTRATRLGAPSHAVLAAVWAGLQHCWQDRALRTCFAYWAAAAVLMMGPMHIAVPVLVNNLDLGTAALGMLSASHGAGILLGMAASGARPELRLRSLGLTMLLSDAVIGLLFMPMGLITATWQGSVLMVLIGALNGYIQVGIFTWLQQRVPPEMMGRTMSLFMFIFMGLVPMSSAATGWLMRLIALPHLFMLCGGLLLLICAAALAFTRIGDMSAAPNAKATKDPSAEQPALS